MRAATPLALLATGCSLIVEPPDAVHPEALVNAIAELDQGNPSVVFTGERYLVVWQDSSLTPPDTSEDAIRARFVSRVGVPLASDLLVNDPGTSRLAQEEPHAAVLGAHVAIAWTDRSGLGGDVDSSIRARVMAATGDFASGELVVNTTVAGVQEDVAVAATTAAFVLVWADASAAPPDTSGFGIRGRRLSPMGAPLELADFSINVTLSGNQAEPAIAAGADNRLLVVWTDTPPTGPSDLRGRLLAADGKPTGPELAINTTLPGAQHEPFAIGLRGGGYLVVWTDESAAADDPEGKAVRGRVLDAAGAGVGDDFVVATTTRGDQGAPKAAVLADGSIVVAYEDGSAAGPDRDANAVRARRLTADGAPLGADYVLNTYYAGDQEDVAIAADGDGGALFVWEDASAGSDDRSGDAVHARFYPP